ncbi:hypothetical protein D3C85_449410 [compost metagenome]
MQVFGRRLVLHIKSQAAIGIELEVRQHARVDQVAIERVGHQQLVLAVVHGQGPERIGRGQGALVEMQGVVVFRGVDRFAVLVDEITDVVRLFGGVAENPHVGAGIAVQVIALEVITGAEEITTGDLVGIDFGFLEFGKPGLGIADAVFQGLALLGAECVDVERLAGLDTDPGEARQQVLFHVLGRGERQHEVQVAEQVRGFAHGRRGFWPVDLRCGGRRFVFVVMTQGFNLVALLDLLDLGQILLIEQLCAVQRIGDVAFTAQQTVDVQRLLALPVGPGDHEMPAIVAGAAGAQVRKVLRIGVDQLHRVVTMLFDGRQGQYQRLGAQIHPDKGVGRVGVRRDKRGVPGSEGLGGVADLIERRLEVRALLVHGLGVERLVHLHHRKAVQVGLPGNGPGFVRGGGEVGPGAGAEGQRKAGEQNAVIHIHPLLNVRRHCTAVMSSSFQLLSK